MKNLKIRITILAFVAIVLFLWLSGKVCFGEEDNHWMQYVGLPAGCADVSAPVTATVTLPSKIHVTPLSQIYINIAAIRSTKWSEKKVMWIAVSNMQIPEVLRGDSLQEDAYMEDLILCRFFNLADKISEGKLKLYTEGTKYFYCTKHKPHHVVGIQVTYSDIIN